MKCLILCRDKKVSWVSNYIQQDSPYMLKFVAKHLIEFYIDLASIAGIKELRIVNDTPDVALENYFSSGGKWGMDISYSISKESDSIEQILKKNNSFIDEDELFIISGFIFIHYNKNQKDFPFISSKTPTTIQSDNGGIYKLDSKNSLEKVNNYKGDDVSITSIKTLKDFYTVSMDILTKKASDYILPGYNNETGVYIGQNVEISRNTKINAPVIISDNVRFKELSSIGPNAIIGNNVLVDKAAIIKNSIIYDASYIGLDLEINNKFIYKNKLADIETGEILEITDNFLISKLDHKSTIRKSMFILHFIGALFLLILMLPLYIILRFIQLLTGDIKYLTKIFYSNLEDEKSITLTIPERYKGWNLFNHIFFKLSIYKTPLLLNVLSGKLNLVGNAPIEKKDENKLILQELSLYTPAVFSYSEMLQTADTEPFENNINELYYCSNHSFLFNLIIIFKSLYGNLFK